MGDNQWDDYDEYEDDDNYDEQDTGPAGLRKANKTLNKKLADLQKKLDASNKSIAEYKVKDSLAEKGITDKRAIRWMSRDDVDLTDSKAIDGWLEENGDLFTGRTPADPDAEHDTDGDSEDDGSSEDAEDHGRIQRTSSTGRASNRSKIDAALAELPDDASPEKVLEVMKKHGA